VSGVNEYQNCVYCKFSWMKGPQSSTYVCVCVCVYVCIYTCTYVGIYIYIYICMYVYMYVCMYMCMYVYMYLYILTINNLTADNLTTVIP
jgi:hypothetical protein